MPDTPEPSQSISDGARPTSRESMRAAVARQLEEAPESDGVPPRIPDHQLLHRIGRGAYGDVWLARNALGTLRAAKVVYRARFKEDRPYEREFNGILKYEPISRTHEGLVQVLHVGRNDEAGCFYYVMELADDSNAEHGTGNAEQTTEPDSVPHSALRVPRFYSPRTLHSELARSARLPPTEAAQLALRLAGALGHLHAHGLVHRDVKPSNVIFVGGLPRLADIGLVTDVGSSHSFVGTEGFIPPEGPGTPQADLYGLGKVLYELATGRDRMDFPQLPPGVTRLPDGEALLELNEVMTRACSPEARQRYASATELQADLNLFLAGRSLRRARNLERHLARLKQFAAAACVFLTLGAGVVWFAGNEARHARERERAANDRARAEVVSREKETVLRRRAEAAEHQTEQQLHAALLEQARATVRSREMGQRVRALDALRRAAAISNTVELRREVFAALALPDLRFERELSAGPNFTFAELDPAFECLAIGRGINPIELRAVSDSRLLATLPATTNLPAHNAVWSADGRFLAVKRDYSALGARADWEIWEATGARRVLVLQAVPWGAVSFHPLLHRVMAGGARGRITVWDLENGREVGSFQLAGEPVHLRFAPDGRRFAASYPFAAGWIVSIHEATNGEPLASHAFSDYVRTHAWHPNGRWLAAADTAGTIHRMEAASGETRVLGRHKADAVTTVFSPDGDYLMTGGWERELICWDARTMQRVFTIGLESYVVQMRADGRACGMRTAHGVQLHVFERPTGHREFAEDLGARLRHAAFSPDGRWLAATAEKRMGVWDLAGNGAAALVDGAREARPFFTPDGRELFASRSGTRDADGFRWRLRPAVNSATPPSLERLPLRKPDDFTFLCLYSNSVVLSSAKGSQVLAPEETETGKNHWTRTAPGINEVSPDGRWLAIYRAFSPTLYVYRLSGLERVAKLDHPANIGGAVFSPQGDEVAIYSRWGVEFWSTQTWERTRSLTNFIRVLYAPDSRGLWLTRDLRTAGLYDARTFEAQLLLPAGMLPRAVSADGRRLAVSVDGQRLQVWDLAQVRAQLRELGLDWMESQ